jgi:hypothetical protein
MVEQAQGRALVQELTRLFHADPAIDEVALVPSTGEHQPGFRAWVLLVGPACRLNRREVGGAGGFLFCAPET